MEEAQHFYLKDTPNVKYTSNKYEALENAHAMILLTEWKTFRAPDFDAIKKPYKTLLSLMAETNIQILKCKREALNTIRSEKNNV